MRNKKINNVINMMILCIGTFTLSYFQVIIDDRIKTNPSFVSRHFRLHVLTAVH